MYIKNIEAFSVSPYLKKADLPIRGGLVTLLYLPTNTYYTFNFNKIERSNNLDVFYGVSIDGIIKIRADIWGYRADTTYMTNDKSYIMFDEGNMTTEDVKYLYEQKNKIHQAAMKNKRYRKLIFNVK